MQPKRPGRGLLVRQTQIAGAPRNPDPQRDRQREQHQRRRQHVVAERVADERPHQCGDAALQRHAIKEHGLHETTERAARKQHDGDQQREPGTRARQPSPAVALLQCTKLWSAAPRDQRQVAECEPPTEQNARAQRLLEQHRRTGEEPRRAPQPAAPRATAARQGVRAARDAAPHAQLRQLVVGALTRKLRQDDQRSRRDQERRAPRGERGSNRVRHPGQGETAQRHRPQLLEQKRAAHGFLDGRQYEIAARRNRQDEVHVGARASHDALGDGAGPTRHVHVAHDVVGQARDGVPGVDEKQRGQDQQKEQPLVSSPDPARPALLSGGVAHRAPSRMLCPTRGSLMRA